MSAGSLVELQQLAAAVGRQILEDWPYPWIYQPPGYVPFYRRDSIEAPAYGSLTEIVSYTVPSGFWGVITGFYFAPVLAAWLEGDGNVQGRLDVNRPIAASLATGYDLNDWALIETTIGAIGRAEPIERNILRDGETVRLKVNLVGTVGVGAPNFIHGGIRGYIWPARR